MPEARPATTTPDGVRARTLRLAVVGCGRIAGAYQAAAARVPALATVACVDADLQRARAAAVDGAAALGDVEELLAGPRPACDAALVLTPPDRHEPLAIRLLEAGVHVLCEKPLSPSLPAARRMIAAAHAAGRVLMMGSKFRFTPDMKRARQLLDAGTIGEVLLFENVFCARVDMRERWNSVRRIAGGGVLLDNGCHSVDIARYLLGPIARVQAQFGKPIQRLEVEDTARLLFESRDGAMGTIDLSWSLHKEVPFYVRLYGSRGALEVGWRTSRYKLGDDRPWVEFGAGYDKTAAFCAQLENFCGVVAGTEEPVITDVDALASVRVIDAAYRSAREHNWHELD